MNIHRAGNWIGNAFNAASSAIQILAHLGELFLAKNPGSAAPLPDCVLTFLRTYSRLTHSLNEVCMLVPALTGLGKNA